MKPANLDLKCLISLAALSGARRAAVLNKMPQQQREAYQSRLAKLGSISAKQAEKLLVKLFDHDNVFHISADEKVKQNVALVNAAPWESLKSRLASLPQEVLVHLLAYRKWRWEQSALALLPKTAQLKPSSQQQLPRTGIELLIEQLAETMRADNVAEPIMNQPLTEGVI